ncbi:MAG: hypothetical protein ACI860_001493, partial [Chitinophagales bacterium]
WLINATGIQGSHYVQGNSTPINDNIDANVQSVEYSNDWAYITTHGIPAYTTGPFLDGNPSLASDQSAIYRFTLNPTENTGTSTSTTGGNIGNFINGVSLFDYRDGVAWNPTTSALCGGPGNPPCPGGPTSSQDWNRDAVPAEKGGFDCAKAHPAMGNYHHHQNPSAFDLDLVTVSTICDLYASDGLYNINPNNHSPLIGFAYDGFPIYGAYAYQNADGTGTIVRMQSGYELLTNTTRINGPNVNTTYFSGYFREDYQFVANTADDFLDEHNGRFCITPEYPNGIYCYFTTVDANWNSAYPYVVGPTFYGNVTSGKVTSINESVNTYVEDTTNTGLINKEELDFEIHIMPNPSSDFIAVQVDNLAQSDFEISLIDITGKLVKKSRLKQGSTVSYLDIQTVYAGAYIVVVSSDKGYSTRNVLIER